MKKILDRYRSIPTPARASLWFIICSAVQNGCRFLAMPLLVRLLTTEQYGIYSVFLSWTSIISIFTTLNLHAGVYNNAMLKYPERRNEYTSASQSLAMVVTGIVFLVYCLFSQWIDSFLGLEHGLVLLVFLQIFFTEGFQLWSTRQRYEYKYIPLVIFTAILSISYMVLPVTAAYFAPNETRLYATVAAGVLVQVLFGVAFIIYNYIKSNRFFVREFWRYALAFNIPLIPHYLSNVILGQADRVMIKRYIGPAEAGIYSLVYNISLAVSIVTGAVNSAIIPYTYEKVKNREYSDLRSVSSYLLLLMSGLVIVLSMFAPELIRVIATEEYYDAIGLVPVIAVSVYFMFLYSLFGNIEFYFGANRFIAVASTVAAVANIALNYLFLPMFGYYAAAYTTLVCYILLSLIHFIFMRIICKRQIGKERIYDGKTALLISVGTIIVAMGVMTVYNFTLIRYLLIVILIISSVLKRRKLVETIGELINKKKEI